MTSPAPHRQRPLHPWATLLAACALASSCSAMGLGHRDAPVTPPAATAHAEAPAKRVKEPKHAKSSEDATTKRQKGRKLADAGKLAKSAPRPPRGSAAEMSAQLVLAPQEPYWPYRIGERLVAADSATFAEEYFQLALSRDAHYPPALAALSRLWFTQRRHEDAIRMLEAERAIVSAEGFPSALSASLALHYDAIGRTDLAKQTLSAVPTSGREDALEANVYLTLRGETPEAAEGIAREAAHDHPKSAANQNNFGITRLRSGEVTDARKAFTRAIDLDPSLPGPYYNLAILEKFYAFDDDAAVRWFKLYRERSSADPDGIAQVFGASVTGELAKKGER